ncbi:MAG: NFACT family protein [Desulfomonile sp.]
MIERGEEILMDLTMMKEIARELNQELHGGIISKVLQPLPREIGLKIFQPGFGEKRLILSSDPKFGRIHLTKLRLINPPRPPRFCSYLRAHLTNARISRIWRHDSDRIVYILCKVRISDSVVERNLILELLGRDSNILLVDATTNLIMDSLCHIRHKDFGNRVVIPGIEYQDPPGNPNQSRSKPRKVDRYSFIGIRTESGDPKPETPVVDSEEDSHDKKINDFADAFFSHILVDSLLENLRRQVSKPIQTRIRSTVNRITKIKNDIEKLESFIDKCRQGELLKTVLKKIRKGQSSVEAPDWETGKTEVIMLEPALDPVSNMRKLFAKSAKGKRGIEIARSRLTQAVEEKKCMEEMLFFVQEAKSPEDLESLSKEFELSGKSVKAAPRKNSRTNDLDSRSGKNYRELVSPSGYPILVGKSAQGNDFITKNKARKGDLWFHAKDTPGSHVILVCRDSREVSDLDIIHCATIAAKSSKLKDTGKVEVMFADAVNVAKVKGGFPGLVTVTRHKTIVVNLYENCDPC